MALKWWAIASRAIDDLLWLLPNMRLKLAARVD